MPSPSIPDSRPPDHVSSSEQPLPKVQFPNRPTEAMRHLDHLNPTSRPNYYSYLPRKENPAAQSTTFPQPRREPVQFDNSRSPVVQEGNTSQSNLRAEQSYWRDGPPDDPYAYVQRTHLLNPYANVEQIPTACHNEEWKQNFAEEKKEDCSMDLNQASGNNHHEDVASPDGING